MCGDVVLRELMHVLAYKLHLISFVNDGSDVSYSNMKSVCIASCYSVQYYTYSFTASLCLSLLKCVDT